MTWQNFGLVLLSFYPWSLDHGLKNAWAFVCKAGLIMMDLLAVKQQFGGAAVDTYHYHFLKGINHRVKRLRNEEFSV